MPKISIVIPTYNAEKTIASTLQSVINQTFSDVEIIIINDGSTDNTLQTIETCQDPRIRVLSYNNAGVAMARNRGISHATGEYIAFIDADDRWTTDKLELQLQALQEHPEAGVAYSWTIDFIDGEEDRQLPGKPVYFSGNVYPQLLISNFLLHGSNPLVSRQAIDSVGEFDPNCTPSEDWDYYIRLAAQWPFIVVPKHQIFYRQSTTSSSSNIPKMEKAGVYTIEKAYNLAPVQYQHLKKQSFAGFFQYCAQRYIQCSHNRQDIQPAGSKLLQSLVLYPPSLGTEYFQRLCLGFMKRWIFKHFPQT